MWRVKPRLARLAVTGALFQAGMGRVVAQQQPDPALLQRYAADGERALADGRYAEAQQAYETLRQLAPGTGEVHARLGLIYFQQGRYAEAIAPLRDALRLKPGLPKVDALLAMSLSEIGRYEEALPALKKTFSQSSDTVLQRMTGLHLQRIHTALGRDRDAVDVALRLSRLFPDDPEVLYHSGRLFANFAYLQTMRLAAVAPDSVWLHQAAGEANESLGLHEAALREYRDVVRLAPRRPGIQVRIGRVLLTRANGDMTGDDAREARRAFEAELALDATNANAAYELAEMERKAGALERARQLFAQAVAQHATFDHALVGLARTLVALGRPAEALPHLRAALDRNPDSEVAHYLMAQACQALGDTVGQEKALAAFARARARTAQRTALAPQTPRDVTPQQLEGGGPR